MLLPPDFQDFCRLLHSEKVEYLLVGGYAVGFYGYPRATGDIDFWVSVSPANAAALVRVLEAFGFGASAPSAEMFLTPDLNIRMGNPPLRIELLTGISGVDFAACWAAHQTVDIDGVLVHLIDLDNLKRNKQASGRLKDLNDLQHLP